MPASVLFIALTYTIAIPAGVAWLSRYGYYYALLVLTSHKFWLPFNLSDISIAAQPEAAATAEELLHDYSLLLRRWLPWSCYFIFRLTEILWILCYNFLSRLT